MGQETSELHCGDRNVEGESAASAEVAVGFLVEEAQRSAAEGKTCVTAGLLIPQHPLFLAVVAAKEMEALDYTPRFILLTKRCHYQLLVWSDCWKGSQLNSEFPF